jgi:hypothetical protein
MGIVPRPVAEAERDIQLVGEVLQIHRSGVQRAGSAPAQGK